MGERRGRWLGLGCLGCAFLLIAAFAWHRYDIADFYWQYRTGRLISESGIPHTDSLTFASVGASWIELRWLYCSALFTLCQAFGMQAPTVAVAACLVVAFGLVVRAGKGGAQPVVASVLVGIAAIASSERFVPRPEVLTFLFVAIYVAVLVRWRERPNRTIWLLPLLQIVWTNSHTLFALGPALVILFAVTEFLGKRRSPREVVGLVLFVLAACLVNPYGVAGALFPLRLFAQTQGTIYKETIAELRSPLAFSGAFTVVSFYVLAGISVLAALVARRRVDAFLGLVCLAFGYLAFSSVRNLPLFCLVAIPFVLHAFATLERPKRWPLMRGVAMAVVIVGTGLGVWLNVTDALSRWRSDKRVFGSGPAPNAYPIDVLARLSEHSSRLRVFNTLSMGGPIEEFGLMPFFDPRLEVHSKKDFLTGLRAATDPAAFKELDRVYQIHFALVDLASPFCSVVAPKCGWILVDFDASGALFKAPGTFNFNPAFDPRSTSEALWAKVEKWPAASQIVSIEDLAGFFIAIDEYSLAATWADRAIERAPRRPKAYAIRGRTEQVAGNAIRAVDSYRKAIECGSNGVAVWRELVSCELQLNDLASAGGHADQMLARFPEDAAAWGMAGAVSRAAGDRETAQARLERSVKLNPKDPSVRHLLGMVAREMGRLDVARLHLGAAANLAPSTAGYALDAAELSIETGNRAEAEHYLDSAEESGGDAARIASL